jgi:Tfp pilus assembly protein PilX
VVKRPGFALAIALLAVVLIAALLAALFFTVNEETRTGSAVASRDDALAAAETAIHSTLQRLEAEPFDQPAGAVETRSLTAGGLPSIVYVTTLDSGLFWLVATVSSDRSAGVSARRIGVFATASESQNDSIRIVRITRRGWSELY